jgi:hypothetical protein
MGAIGYMKTGRIMAIFFIAVLFGCQIFQNRDVPEELLGVWETSSPRYEDCSLEFDNRRVIFQNGLTHFDINHITNVKKSTEDEKTLYHIYYKDNQGGEYKLSLYYLEGPDKGVIRFKHQEEIAWLKRGGQSE